MAWLKRGAMVSRRSTDAQGHFTVGVEYLSFKRILVKIVCKQLQLKGE